VDLVGTNGYRNLSVQTVLERDLLAVVRE